MQCANREKLAINLVEFESGIACWRGGNNKRLPCTYLKRIRVWGARKVYDPVQRRCICATVLFLSSTRIIWSTMLTQNVISDQATIRLRRDIIDLE
jgi:hypothetical protein